MLFKEIKDIEQNIKYRISNFIKSENYKTIDIKYITSLISTYLIEIKNIKEISGYIISIIDDTSFNIILDKNNEIFTFNVSLFLEMRNIKIKKIYQRK